MMVFLILALVIVAGLVVALVVGKVGKDEMSAPNRTSPFELPDGPLRSTDVENVRFDQALRGYNMAQVDAVLDKLHQELRRLEQDRVQPRRWSGVADSGPGEAPIESGGSIVQFRSRARDEEVEELSSKDERE